MFVTLLSHQNPEPTRTPPHVASLAAPESATRDPSQRSCPGVLGCEWVALWGFH